MPAKSIWTFSSPLGELRHGGVSARVDVARPELGVHGVAIESQALTATLLKVRREISESPSKAARDQAHAWPLTVADAYVRGSDLIATYQPADDWPYAPQIYWRTDESAAAAVPSLIGNVSLLVSVQTHLLDTRPRIVVSSEMKCEEVFQLTHQADARAMPLNSCETIQPAGEFCCIVRRLAEVPFSYAEMMSASDFHELRISPNGAGNRQVEWELFSEFLEKGVIRRARIDGFLLPRDHDLELAAACCTSALRLPLPLTT